LHHAFSRADISHLAQVIHPFALGALALLGFLGARKSYDWAAVVLLIAAALFIVSRRTPIYQRITSATPWVSFDAGRQDFCACRYQPAVYLFTKVRCREYRASGTRTHCALPDLRT